MTKTRFWPWANTACAAACANLTEISLEFLRLSPFLNYWFEWFCEILRIVPTMLPAFWHLEVAVYFKTCFDNCLILLNHLLVSRWPLGFRMPHEVATHAWREGQLTQLSQVSSNMFQSLPTFSVFEICIMLLIFAYFCSCNLHVFDCVCMWWTNFKW